MTLRPMAEDDAAAIAEIEREAFKEHAWSAALFRDELKDPDKYYFVAIENGSLAGYGGFAHILDEAHIMNIAVGQAYRRQGTGRAILKRLLEEAKKLGAVAVTLEVSEKNAAAIALYESVGFVYAGTRKDYYAKGDGARIYWLKG